MVIAAMPSFAVNGVKMATITHAYLESKPVRKTKLLLTGFCRQFYTLRPAGGTGSGIAVRFRDDSLRKVLRGIAPPPSGTLSLCCSTSSHAPGMNINLASRNSRYVAPSAVRSGDMGPMRRCVVLDIEGTTTPISFVTEVLFPYARDSVGRHLSATYNTPETQDDVMLLRAQIEDDLEHGVASAIPVPLESEGKEAVVAALVANVEAMIKADRKITALKQLQGHIWRTGFQNGELEAVVFEDVPEALERWHTSGIKVYIYSSGSRLAQRLIFGNTNYGDLRRYLSGFFDTNVGNKKEARSYLEISESLGVDFPSEILFVTDVFQEATAAKAAGLDVVISIRPGNGPLPENHGFRTVTSFSEI